MRNLLRTVVAACLLMPTAYAQQDAAGNAAEDQQPIEQRVLEMIRSGDLESASKAIEAVENPQAETTLRRQLMQAYLQKGDYTSAYSVVAAMVEEGMSNLDDPQSVAQAVGNFSMLASLAQRADKMDEVKALLDTTMQRLESQRGDAAPSVAYYTVGGLKAGVLQRMDQQEDATELVKSLLDSARKGAEQNPGDAAASNALMNMLSTASNVLTDPEESAKYANEAIAMAKQTVQLQPNDMQAVSRYASLAMSSVARMARADAEAAKVALTDLRSTLADIASENEGAKQLIEQMERSLGGIERTIESTLRLNRLVGSEAPEITPEYWVNAAEGMDVESLRGKVVLLDFWAVWCGPCIATFPHLREWQEEFGDEGLQIVGVTRRYNYQWDEEAERATRADGELSAEEELAMLEKFMAFHELQHPSIVTPEESEMQTEFAVTGIPHAVLIDREGKIQMIKVGSGEANATALHDKIVELLGQ